ncbi:MAG: hypothetical protein V3W19_03975, partial [Desulfatiglandales bacterium]
MSFYNHVKHHPWDLIKKEIQSASEAHVERALTAKHLNLQDFISLLSPVAEPYLEDMAQRAHHLTEQRFGKVMGLFAPLYLSNICTNSC